jgi:hypothetical protein
MAAGSTILTEVHRTTRVTAPAALDHVDFFADVSPALDASGFVAEAGSDVASVDVRVD